MYSVQKLLVVCLPLCALASAPAMGEEFCEHSLRVNEKNIESLQQLLVFNVDDRTIGFNGGGKELRADLDVLAAALAYQTKFKISDEQLYREIDSIVQGERLSYLQKIEPLLESAVAMNMTIPEIYQGTQMVSDLFDFEQVSGLGFKAMPAQALNFQMRHDFFVLIRGENIEMDTLKNSISTMRLAHPELESEDAATAIYYSMRSKIPLNDLLTNAQLMRESVELPPKEVIGFAAENKVLKPNFQESVRLSLLALSFSGPASEFLAVVSSTIRLNRPVDVEALIVAVASRLKQDNTK